MKLNSKFFPLTSALLLVSAGTRVSANPAASPIAFTADSSTLSINLTGIVAEPLWTYSFMVLPQGAIAQPRPVLQNVRAPVPVWSPLAIRPGSSNVADALATPPFQPSPLASLLPTEQAQSTIAISNRASIRQIRRVKHRAQREAAAPVPLHAVAAKPVVIKSAPTKLVPIKTDHVKPAPATPVVVKSVATPRPILVAVRPSIITVPEGTPPIAPDEVTAKTPAVAAQTAATPTPLGSRHKDLTLLAQMEADLNRSDRRLKSAKAKLSEGQSQLSKCADTLRQAMMEAGPDARGLHPFVRVAQRYAGTPYVWGGESARGFDCSGFIIRVMRDLGYRSLPHSAAEQFSYGQPIARELMKPGDLVFFKNTYKAGISHVGIYLGKGRFIHAAGTGKGTIVSSLFEAKWRPGGPHYAGARRLIAARNG